MNNNYNYDKTMNTKFESIKNRSEVGVNMQTFENSIEQALENIAKRSQREVPQNGSFATVVEKFKNPEDTTFAKDFYLEIAAGAGDSLKDIRFINVKTEHPHLDKVRGGAIFIGTTDEVLEFLKEPKKYSALVKNMVIEDSERLS